jgi:WD40 repeat protein
VLDVASGEVVASLPNQMVERIYGRRLASPDLSLVGSVAPDGSSAVLHLPTLEVVAELDRCTIPHAFSPDDALVLVAPGPCPSEPPPDAPSNSQVVDVDSGEVVFRIPLGWIFAAVFDPTGTMLAVTDQYEVRIYEVATGRTVGRLAASEVGATNLTDLSFDHDGEHLAVGSTEGVVAVIDLAAMEDGSTMGDALVFNQVTHTASVPTAALSDAGLLATRGYDSLVRLWDLDTGQLLVEFRTEIGGASPDIRFSLDGSSLLYPEGNLIRRFYVDPERLIELAESRLTRSLTPDECRRFLDPAQCPSDET